MRPSERARTEVLDPQWRARLRQCLKSPSGQAVMIALAQQTEPRTALQLATVAFLSTTAVRTQAYRAARLGYAVQTETRANRTPAMAWRITERGRDFLVELQGRGT